METLMMLLFPLLSAFAIRLVSGYKASARAALMLSLVPVADVIWKLMQFNPSGGTQFALQVDWIGALGVQFNVGLDGISMLMVLLTAALVPVIILSAWSQEIRNYRNFFSLIFFMQFALTGVFCSLDGFLFYVFWELALIPVWFICLLWGGADRIRITLRFFIYTLSGSLVMLVGLIYLYLQTPAPHTFSIDAFYALQLTPEQQSGLFWAFFAAFAIKIPIWPLHSWQPDTYTDAPAQGTMLLSGIMLKMGLYGIIRWMIPVIPQGVHQWAFTAAVLAAIGVIYASSMALAQRDFKRMAAYASMAHVGLIAAGIFSLTLTGLQGSVFQMLSHGVNAVGLFLIAEIILRRMDERKMDEMGGVAHVSKKFAIGFMIVLLGNVALPLTNGFVGEFLLLTGMYQLSPWLTAFAGLSVILGAVYMLRAYQRIMLGPENASTAAFRPLDGAETTVLVLVAAAIILMGVYPKPILDIAEPSLQFILNQAGASL